MELSVHQRIPQPDDMGQHIIVARRAASRRPSQMRHPALGLVLIVVVDLGCVGLIHYLFY